jgi:hypothetical protein
MDLQKLIALTEELESLDIELSSTKKSYEDLKTKIEEKEKQINELTKDSEYKTRDEFNWFLKDRNIEDNYYINVDKNPDYIFNSSKWYFIISAFVWSDVPEGQDFWSKINDEWCTYLMNKNNY